MDNYTYEVHSQLNPRYLETLSMSDYYGIYEVVKIERATGQVIGKSVAIYSAGDDEYARHKAYKHANQLIGRG